MNKRAAIEGMAIGALITLSTLAVGLTIAMAAIQITCGG